MTIPKPHSTSEETPVERLAIVLFADLLGFSHQVERAESSRERIELSKRIHRFAIEFSERGANADFYGKKYWAFSDSIVVAWYEGSKAEAVMTEFDAHLFELSGIAFAQAFIMQSDEQLVRGGVARDWLLENGDAVVGEALVRAARLEKQVSAPFIAVEHKLYDFYVNHKGRSTYHESIDPVPSLFIPPSEYTNHLPALDYFMVAIGEIDLNNQQIDQARSIDPGDARDEFRNDCHHKNVIEFIEWHRDFIIKGLTSLDENIAKKYASLRDHHNFRVAQISESADNLLI